MTSHELARLLLAHPDKPIATHANNHTTRDECKIGVLSTGEVVLGNLSKRNINPPNEVVVEMWSGDCPLDWPRPSECWCRG